MNRPGKAVVFLGGAEGLALGPRAKTQRQGVPTVINNCLARATVTGVTAIGTLTACGQSPGQADSPGSGPNLTLGGQLPPVTSSPHRSGSGAGNVNGGRSGQQWGKDTGQSSWMGAEASSGAQRCPLRQGDQNSGRGQNFARNFARNTVTLTVVHTRQLGPVVVRGLDGPGGQRNRYDRRVPGWTLYRYDMDDPRSGRSTDVGECAGMFMPVLAPGNVELDGLERNQLGSVRRDDGTRQLTLNGWPLYQSTRDECPGDANDQGAQGAWWVVAPDGRKAGVDGSAS